MTAPDIIRRAEAAWGGPVAAARACGIPYATWKSWKNGRRGMRPSVRQSIEAHLRLAALEVRPSKMPSVCAAYDTDIDTGM